MLGPMRALAVALALLVAAGCSSGSGSSAPADDDDRGNGTASAAVDEEGVLRYAYGLVEVSFDPIHASTPADFTYQHLAYGTLLREREDGSFEPNLAASADVVDPRTIEVDLRPDVTFQDGTPFDAEAVRAGLQRNVDAKRDTGTSGAGRAFPVELAEIDRIEVTAELSLRLRLRSDSAGVVYPLLAGNASMIVSPKAAGDESIDLRERPVGAGPFRLTSFVPEQEIRFERWDGYWDASSVRLAGVELVHVANHQSGVNAFRGGSVDALFAGAESIEPFTGPGVETDVRPSDNSIYWMPICKSRPPFDDLRVRQALNYAVDRDAINDVLFGGGGEPQWGVWTSRHVLHPDGVDGMYDHDPAKARKLLADAGVEDLSVEIMTVATPSITTFAEMIQDQYADVGIDVTISPSPNIVQDFFIDAKAPLGAIPYVNRGITKLAGNFYPGSLANVCKYDDPKMNAMIDEIRGVAQGSDEAVRLWQRAQRYVAEQALVVHGLFTPQANVWDGDRVGGVRFRPDALGRPTLDFLAAYVKR